MHDHAVFSLEIPCSKIIYNSAYNVRECSFCSLQASLATINKWKNDYP
jgi:hypothetical protein